MDNDYVWYIEYNGPIDKEEVYFREVEFEVKRAPWNTYI